MRASEPVSVRWLLSKRTNEPSGLHETELLFELARKLIGRAILEAPPFLFEKVSKLIFAEFWGAEFQVDASERAGFRALAAVEKNK